VSGVPPNYDWWRSHGGGWRSEVERRKRSMPIYHLQELLLQDYLGRCAPANVLEFGCGYGRHLSYLRQVPGLEVHGFEQSPSMLEDTDLEPDWVRSHVRMGDPLAPLPYEDGAFDVVLTVSVLIHVRPEDLDTILAELVRVARWQVFHVENNDTRETHVTSEAHDGCWAHDLRAAYGRLGLELELLPRCFELEDVYRVPRDAERPLPELSPALAERLLGLDRALSSGIRELQGEATRAARAEESLRERVAKLEDRLEAARGRVDELQSGREDARRRAREAEAKLAPVLERARRAEAGMARLVEETREGAARHEELARRARDAEAARAASLERAREAEARAESLLARARQAAELHEALRQRTVEAEQAAAAALERARGAEARGDDLLARAREAGELHAPLRERAQRAEQSAAQARERAREAEERAAEQLERSRELGRRASELAERSQRAEREREALRARAREAEQRAARLAEQLRTSVEGLTRARGEIEQLRGATAELRAELDASRETRDRSLARADDLRALLEQREHELGRLRKRLWATLRRR